MHNFFLTVTHDLLHHFSFKYRHTPPPCCLPLVFLSPEIPQLNLYLHISACVMQETHCNDAKNTQALPHPPNQTHTHTHIDLETKQAFLFQLYFCHQNGHFYNLPPLTLSFCIPGTPLQAAIKRWIPSQFDCSENPTVKPLTRNPHLKKDPTARKTGGLWLSGSGRDERSWPGELITNVGG